MSSIIRSQLHIGVYAAVIVATVLLHGDRPIQSTSAKLTLLLMGLMILADAVLQLWRARKGPGPGGIADP
ncbi:MAG: hypothetical protein QNJ40_13035 [Xanthomonadales bacterium]|nr:hypothetical protein [Xanthomonadales bacterium]